MEIEGELKTALKERKVQFEMFFTLPDFSDISLRDYQETMQRPFFSLSKRKRIKPIDYTSPDKSVSVHVSPNPAYGMATIWDADIMIYLASHLNELRERGANDLSPVIRLQPGDLLKRICWGTSGRAYERLVNALDRLQATTIKTNIRASAKSRETTFSWIDSYTHLVDERTQRSLGMEITLSKWFFDGVMDKRNVLSISPLYFEITSGLGKWLYRASRKHAGGNGADGFTIGFETLHQKSGSESLYPVFKRKLLDLARANDLPDISLEVIDGDGARPKMKMVMRRHLGERARTRRQAALPSPALPTDDGADQDMVDPRLALGMISSLSRELRVGADAPPRRPIRTAPQRRSDPAGRTTASRMLDAEIYSAIRADFPGWDYDELMRRFDAFLGANPSELPRNYSKRFYGFVKEHHRRNKYRL
ncbi:Plasmid replication initiator protein [Sphingobium indicum BiD32]|uniref:Plasmid replication initiator protein n=1 Tax=Sphingobium indicum BiD32 TaxID=1301087 RepID=N1MQG1_9SPHN|nr:replication initiator protein A [Sphingobium indicum]CCW17907.1 Plasmid replication initiator protein [Sphingobium indicum BiD32]